MRKDQPGLRRTALTSLASFVVPVLIALVAMPIVFRLLGASMFGVLSITLLAPALAASLDFGLTSAATRRLAMDLESEDPSVGRTVSSYGLALLGVGLVLGLAVALAAPALVEWLDFKQVVGMAAGVELIRLCAFWMALSLMLSLPSIVLRARQRFGQLTVIQTVATLALWLGAVVLASRQQSLWMIVAVSMLTAVGSSIACLILARRELPARMRYGVDPGVVLQDIEFSSGLFLVQLSNVVAFQLDRVLVAGFASPAAAGVYALCVGIANKTLFAISALTSFTFPRVAAMRSAGAESEIGALLQAVMRVSLVTIAPVILPALVLAGPFLSLWLGTSDLNYVTLLQLLFAGYAIAAYCAPATHVITGTGTSRLAATFAWVTATLLVGGMALFVPAIGLVGAGVANLVALSSSLVFLQLVRRRLPSAPHTGQRRLLAGIAIGCMAQGALLALAHGRIDSWPMFVIVGILSLAVFEAARWLHRSFSGEERRLLNSLFSRLRRLRSPPP